MKTPLSTILIAILLGAAAAQSSSGGTQSTPATPTLAEVAAKEKKNKAKRVITNEDIPERAPDTSSSSSPSSPVSGSSQGTELAGTAGSKNGGDNVGNAKQGEKGEKQKPNADAVAAAESKIAELKKEEEGFNHGVQQFEKLLSTGDEFRKRNLSDSLQKYRDDLADTQKKREAAETELDKLKNPKKQ
jgi:hypothetical protein